MLFSLSSLPPPPLQDILDMDMPDLPEDQTPQEDSDISIELQFPIGIEVALT